MGRKPRSDAKLHQLPMEQQMELCEMLLGGMSYAGARAVMKKEWEVVVSTGAIFDFYHSFCAPELLRRRAEAVSTADSIAEEAAATPGKWNEAALDRLRQFAFEMMLQPNANAKDLKAVFGLVFKAKDQEMEDRRITLLEEKAKKADEASGVANNEALSEDEKAARLKQIFRMG